MADLGRARTSWLRSRWLLVLCVVVSLPAVTTRINASDEIQFFSWLHSWTFDRDVDFTNEYRYFHDAGPGGTPGFVDTFLEASNEAGRRPNFAPIGSAVLWLPFYAGGHLAAGLSGVPTDGLSHPYIAAIAYGSAFYGLLAVLMSAAIANRLVGRSGLGAAVLIAIGTPLLFYVYVAPGFAHACSAFSVSLFLWTWLRVRGRWSIAGVVWLGVTAALLPMVREQDVFFVAGPAIDFLRWSARQLRGGPAGGEADPVRVPGRGLMVRAAAGVAATIVAYLPQLLSYQALNGHPGPTTTVVRKMTWTSPHALEVLVSFEHGLFFWTPLAIVAVGGLLRLWIGRRTRTYAPEVRWLAWLFLLMFVLQVYVSGAVESWTVAGAFGQRRFVAVTPLLATGLAAVMPESFAHLRRRAAFAALAAVCVWWNLGLIAQFGLHLMDRQRLSPIDNARVTFLELPRRAPAIAIRYLTDRESLYRLPRERVAPPPDAPAGID